MIDFIPPFIPYLIGAALLPLIPAGRLRSTIALLMPIIGAVMIAVAPDGHHANVGFFGFELGLFRLDPLAEIFGYLFSLAAFLALIYAWRIKDTIQQVATLLYAGAAIGAVFAADLITLFFFWEGTAIASVFLIWARKTQGAYHTAMRYLLMQVGSGVLLIAGIILYYFSSGDIGFAAFELPITNPAQFSGAELGIWLIFIAFGIKCAFPMLHGWLIDAYPAATITGAVVLSTFTTKLAIYCLARGFAGAELLIYIGAVMALFAAFYALIENDLRRVLAYSLINQLGFMLIGIGVGTSLALNGAIAHATVSTFYKSLLFMTIGAVLYRTGSAKATDLGGLYRTMPMTALFCIIGAASICAVPLFSGFVAKSLIFSGALNNGHYIIWGILVFSSAAVVIHTGIKIPYMAFFGTDRGLRPKEAPAHMRLAMGATALICIAIGVYPDLLYRFLPFALDYKPYTSTHIITQLQLLCFSALAMILLIRLNLYPIATRAVHLDFDAFYRTSLSAVISKLAALIITIWQAYLGAQNQWIANILGALNRKQGNNALHAAASSSGAMVLSISAVLGLVLFVIFFS